MRRCFDEPFAACSRRSPSPSSWLPRPDSSSGEGDAGQLFLFVGKQNQQATYSVGGTVTKESVDFDLGALGEVKAAVRPSGKKETGGPSLRLAQTRHGAVPVQREPPRQRPWRGNLTVNFPGHAAVPMAGPGFKASIYAVHRDKPHTVDPN